MTYEPLTPERFEEIHEGIMKALPSEASGNDLANIMARVMWSYFNSMRDCEMHLITIYDVLSQQDYEGRKRRMM